MTIKFAGSEPPFLGGGFAVTTTAGLFDANYSRAAVHGKIGAPVTASVPYFGEGDADGWEVSFLARTNSSGLVGDSFDQPYCAVTTSTGAIACAINQTNSSATFIAYATDGTSASQALSSAVFWADSLNDYRINMRGYQSGADAIYTLHINNALAATLTIANKTVRGFASISVTGGNWTTTSADGNYPAVSEMMIADEPLLYRRLKTIPPTGDGAVQDWAGAYGDIDETGSTADGISTATDGDISTFTHAAVSVGAIQCLLIGSDVAAGAGGDVEGVLRIGGTNYTAAHLYTVASNPAPNFAVFELSPATSEPFTNTEVSGLEWGFKKIAAA